MQRIEITPRYPRSEPHDDDRYHSIYYKIDESYAISTDGTDVDLVKIEPDPKKPGAYQLHDDWDSPLTFAIDKERTVDGLARIVEQLKGTSAYCLLTEHMDNTSMFGIRFHVNAPALNYGGEPPVDELNPPTGGDY